MVEVIIPDVPSVNSIGQEGEYVAVEVAVVVAVAVVEEVVMYNLNINEMIVKSSRLLMDNVLSFILLSRFPRMSTIK